MIRFHWLSGDMNWQEYGGKWISDKLNNGEFDYWLVLEFLNWHDAVGKQEAPAKYHTCISVVSPQEAGEDNIGKALESCGMTRADISEKYRDESLVETLHSYGIFVPVWQQNGDNCRALLAEARKQAQIINVLFGFFMDKPVNAIGTRGWDAVKGNIMAGLGIVG